MGVGYTIKCEKCGNNKEILIGGGMLPAESFKQEILDGKFGLDAKEIMEEHPDWGYYVEQFPFSCSCNYVTSFPAVTFFNKDGKKIRCDRYRCCQCGKTLRANSWGKGICWKCGGRMIMFESLLWD